MAWWLISPLWINKTVDDVLPTAAKSPQTQATGNVQMGVTIAPDKTLSEVEMLVEQVAPADREQFMQEMEDQKTHEMAELVPSSPRILSQGNFYSVAHEGSGIAKLLSVDGSNILRLENLDVLNGPDLRVVLSKNTGIRTSADLGDYIELDTLKGNKGNQNYEIDSSIDIGEYKSAVVYCKAFHVVFNVAELQ